MKRKVNLRDLFKRDGVAAGSAINGEKAEDRL